MATVINIHQAKTHLSRIVDEVATGREVIIAKAVRKVARLVPNHSKPAWGHRQPLPGHHWQMSTPSCSRS